MASTRLRSLSHHPDDYAKSFSAYMAVSDKFDSYATWGDNVFGKAVTSKITVMLGEQEELRILGIGSGSGELDVKMLTKLLLRFPLINNRVVEPAGFMIAKYKALVESKAHDLQGVRCDWRQQTMQQYAKEAGDSTKFHFIHACQSLYFVEDLESSLMFLFDCLEPGGVLLMTTLTDSCGVLRLWNHFPRFQDNLLKLISTTHLLEYLDGRGIAYTEHCQPSRVDVTECFDETSEKGGRVLDALLHILRFRETASDELQAEVMKCLASCSEKSGSRVFLTNDWDAVVASKPAE